MIHIIAGFTFDQLFLFSLLSVLAFVALLKGKRPAKILAAGWLIVAMVMLDARVVVYPGAGCAILYFIYLGVDWKLRRYREKPYAFFFLLSLILLAISLGTFH